MTPITQRRDDLKREIKALGERLVEAERAAKDGEALAKAEAIRNVLGKVYLHFDSVKTAKLTKAPLMPEKTEFETVATTAQSSRP